MTSTESHIGRVLWHHVAHADDGSGYWELVRLIRWDDGRVMVETNTRGSVVSTQVTLTPKTVVGLIEAVEALR